ncbi:Uncharacterised protein [Kaistella antarctica]|uniref:Uncharacterized protein n=1 Tax=Kaistella antarctica TaxID=266748 RepID=A0A448NM74_9FLAO|nr:Uncharacterised protein [Kaistella antarctica]
MIFSILLKLGFKISDKKIIIGGIAKTNEAVKSIKGLFKAFSPLLKLSILPGVYNSK